MNGPRSSEQALTCEDVKEALTSVAEFGVASSEGAGLLDVGTQQYLQFFRTELLEGLVRSAGSTCRIYEGAYGEGKTHLLGLLREQSLELGMAAVSTDLSQAMSLYDWRLITKNVLAKIEVRIEGERISGLPDILDVLGDSGANETALREARLPHAGFRAGMVYALNQDLDEDAWDLLKQYLLGDRIGAGKLAAAGISGVKNPLSARNAELILGTVLGGLHALGLPGTMMLFDETEETFSGKQSNKMMMAANLIRRLIDSCIDGALPGTIAIFAVLPGFLESAGLAYQALGQRLEFDRSGSFAPSWRWPVLQVEQLLTSPDPADFLESAIDRMIYLMDICGAGSEDLRVELRARGERVLSENAGTGYRRELMKALTNFCVRRM